MPSKKSVPAESVALETSPTRGEALAFLGPLKRLLAGGIGVTLFALGAFLLLAAFEESGQGISVVLQWAALGLVLVGSGSGMLQISWTGHRAVQAPRRWEAFAAGAGFLVASAMAVFSGNLLAGGLALLAGAAGTYDVLRQRRWHEELPAEPSEEASL